MDARDRLLEFLKYLGIGQTAFEEKVGISRGYINKVRGGSIGSQIVTRIATAYPELNIMWLSTGVGEMLISRDTLSVMRDVNELREPGLAYEQGVTHLEQRARLVPHIVEECADCGRPNGFEVAILEDRCPKYVIPGLVGCDFTIPARGRSMINRSIPEKSIKEGDIIGCRKWTSRSHIRWGEVYVLSTTGGITVKQVLPSERDGYVRCVPFNTDEGFQEFELPVEEIYDWAIVVGVASVSMWS